MEQKLTQNNAVQRDVIEKLLEAITLDIGEDGLMCSFMFGRPNSFWHERRMGTTIFFHEPELTLAMLHVRKNGPLYLRALPISKIKAMLKNFICENFWYLADECFVRRFQGTFAKNVNEATKLLLSDRLASDSLFQPSQQLYLFPFTISVSDNFDSTAFFLTGAEGLTPERLPEGLRPDTIVSTQSPPLANWEGRTEQPTAWLGVRAPAPEAAEAMKCIILGALALTQIPSYRHMFSGRQIFGGTFTIDQSFTIKSTKPHTPPIMHDITVGLADHKCLSLLSEKLNRNEKTIRRQMRALRYFYKAWFFEESGRFLYLCMALDAIFGEVGSAAQAIIDNVRETVGHHVKDSRLRKLMNLRAAALHGGAPEVYDSSKYDDYLSTYLVDPIRDIELLVSYCLRAKIFDFKLLEHADPLAETIAQAQSAGRLPIRTHRPTILDNMAINS